MSKIAIVLLVILDSSFAITFAQTCSGNDPQQALFDLGTDTYKTFQGGLYPAGSNVRPSAHQAAGLAIAESVVPLDVAGNEDPAGRIVLVSIGYSNMTQEWAAGAVGDPGSVPFTFKSKAQALQQKGAINPQLLIVDCAKGGQANEQWSSPIDPQQDPWLTALQRLSNAGSSRFQVQVACVKVAHVSPNTCMASDGSSTGDAGMIAESSAAMLRNLKIVFPNLRLAYFISRTYGGYALTGLNPEPFAYETAFGVKWMLEAQITGSGVYGNLNYNPLLGPVAAPWAAWGPDLWAKGTSPNALGIAWELQDFRENDRTHPALGAVDKVSDALLDFFLNDSTTEPWFAVAGVQPVPALSQWASVVLGLGLMNLATLLTRRKGRHVH